MVFDEQLMNKLANESTLTALISTRIYPSVMPDTSQFPAMVYDIISENDYRSPIGGNRGLINLVMQFTILGKTRTSVRAIKEVLRDILQNFQDYTNFGDYYLQLCTELPSLGTNYEDNIYDEKLEFQFIYNEK